MCVLHLNLETLTFLPTQSLPLLDIVKCFINGKLFQLLHCWLLKNPETFTISFSINCPTPFLESLDIRKFSSQPRETFVHMLVQNYGKHLLLLSSLLHLNVKYSFHSYSILLPNLHYSDSCKRFPNCVNSTAQHLNLWEVFLVIYCTFCV